MKKISLNRFADELLDIMPLMFREYARREDNALVRGKISCPQMVALNLAAERREVTVGEIARVLSSEKSSASVLLERLVRQKMMSRRHDQKDRRLVWMSLTPKGRKVINQILAQKRGSLKAIFGKLSAGERGQYLAVLRKVRTNLLKSCCVALFCGLAAQGAFAADPAPAAEPAALDVLQAYRMALKQSETVAISEKEIDLARSRFYRSFDYFLPNVYFEMTRFDQDAHSNSSSFGDSSRRSTPENKFVFSQPIFSGFKELAAIRAVGDDRREQEARWRRAQELLFVDVAEAFYNVLSARQDLDLLEKQKKLLEDRVKELKQRVGVGRSREGEMKSAFADQKSVEADLVQARSVLARAENLLAFYIGRPVSDFRLEDASGASAEGPALDASLQNAHARSDVSADEAAYRQAIQKVVAAQADLFPTASIDGNYYTRRVGFQNGNDWDVTLKLDVPVFEVGTTLGDIKEAQAEREQKRLTAQQTLRSAGLDIRNAYEDWTAARESEDALKAAADAARANSDLETEDYRHNLVSNLDVLDALRRTFDIERRASTSVFEAKKAYWRFQIASGELPS